VEKGTARRIIILGWLLALAIVSADELAKNKSAAKGWPTILPCPARYTKATVAYTLIGLIGEFMPQPAAILGLGLAVGMMTRLAASGRIGVLQAARGWGTSTQIPQPAYPGPTPY
jgi:hypothetical protein